MGAVDQLARDQAIRVLLACRELFTDEELQENLAGLDAQCGGVMASWQPPWVDEGVEEMNFDEDMLQTMPVEDWVLALDGVLQKLSTAAEEAQLISDAPAFVVVIPGGPGLPVIPTLVRLGGGRTLSSNGTGDASTLPFSRFIFPKALDGMQHDDSPGRTRLADGGGLPWNDFVKDAKLDRSVGDGYPEQSETLRSQAFKAVLHATVPGEMVPPEVTLPLDEPLQDKRTQDESVSSGAATCQSRSLPSSIKFLHLGILQAATECHGEAAGLILGVMQLLREEEIWAKLIALDAYCDNLLSNWQPPWDEETGQTTGPMTLERLQGEDESTIYDWAMALDGFCSFVANLAVAARIHHQVSNSGEVAASSASAEEVTVGETSPVEEPSPAASSKGHIALVVVVPDDLTDWHLEVFGPLLRAFKIFILTEKAWRADFNAASTVPFSVEAASAMASP